jgi:hypothetical protein
MPLVHTEPQRKYAPPKPRKPLPTSVPATYTRDEGLALLRIDWDKAKRWMRATVDPLPKACRLAGNEFRWRKDELDAWMIRRLA